jgi:hypothetical protein
MPAESRSRSSRWDALGNQSVLWRQKATRISDLDPLLWYRFGTQRTVRYVQNVDEHGHMGRWGRSGMHLHQLPAGWGPKGRRFKSGRPDIEKRPQLRKAADSTREQLSRVGRVLPLGRHERPKIRDLDQFNITHLEATDRDRDVEFIQSRRCAPPAPFADNGEFHRRSGDMDPALAAKSKGRAPLAFALLGAHPDRHTRLGAVRPIVNLVMKDVLERAPCQRFGAAEPLSVEPRFYGQTSPPSRVR